MNNLPTIPGPDGFVDQDELTNEVVPYLTAAVRKWMADVDDGSWRHVLCEGQPEFVFVFINNDEPEQDGIRFWPVAGKVEVLPAAAEQATDYEPFSRYDCDGDWRTCRCDDCADERSLQRAKAVDPERYETL